MSERVFRRGVVIASLAALLIFSIPQNGSSVGGNPYETFLSSSVHSEDILLYRYSLLKESVEYGSTRISLDF